MIITNLYQILSAAFCVIAVISNIISAKMVPLPFTSDLYIPAGLFIYPLTFLLSNLVIEFYGAKQAKLMIYTAFAMNLMSLVLIEFALRLPSSEEEQYLFKAVLGLSGLRILASLAAYLAGQLADIKMFTLIRDWTDARFLWLRNNGAYCISQIVDTFLLDVIYLYIGLGIAWSQVWPIMCFSYLYKISFNIGLTPFLYFSVYIMKTKLNIRRTV
ncbi:MAG: queuosine precursor transporter [Parachlamydiaceae bacterium]|nr:MAG: queuosine precursor transporter [Parachlamydiaceae bacterium]